MKNLFIKSSLLILLINSLSWAGSGAGNGTDTVSQWHGMAFFANPDREVRYCMVVSDDFFVNSTSTIATLENAVEFSIQSWINYLKQKRILSDGRPFSLRYSLMKHCDGTENLKLYFGIEDETVTKLKRGYFEPIGFAEMISYDSKANFGMGIIWLRRPIPIAELTPEQIKEGRIPNLAWDETRLKAELVHEFGHVFGCTHVSDTIMSSDWGKVVRSGGIKDFSIDQGGIELVMCRECTYEFQEFGHAQLNSRFKKLTGRKPVGKVTGTLRLKEGRIKTGKLLLKDDNGSVEFSLTVYKDIVWRNGTGNAFEAASFGGYRAGGGGSYYGSMTLPSGKRIPIALNRSLSYFAEIVDLSGPVSPDMEDDSDFFHGHTMRVLNE